MTLVVSAFVVLPVVTCFDADSPSTEGSGLASLVSVVVVVAVAADVCGAEEGDCRPVGAWRVKG